MKPVILSLTALVFCCPARAHRLDEYLQAATIAIEQHRIQLDLRLAPGVAVLPVVLAAIDADGNGVLSNAEQQAYSSSVLRDLKLSLDDAALPLHIVSFQFPALEELREGRGEIQLKLSAAIPRRAPLRKLTFENHHRRAISAYLVNSLVPRDPLIRINGQNRNYEQSFYQLEFQQPDLAGTSVSGVWIAAALLGLWLLRLLSARTYSLHRES